MEKLNGCLHRMGRLAAGPGEGGHRQTDANAPHVALSSGPKTAPFGNGSEAVKEISWINTARRFAPSSSVSCDYCSGRGYDTVTNPRVLHEVFEDGTRAQHLLGDNRVLFSSGVETRVLLAWRRLAWDGRGQWPSGGRGGLRDPDGGTGGRRGDGPVAPVAGPLAAERGRVWHAIVNRSAPYFPL